MGRSETEKHVSVRGYERNSFRAGVYLTGNTARNSTDENPEAKTATTGDSVRYMLGDENYSEYICYPRSEIDMPYGRISDS